MKKTDISLGSFKLKNASLKSDGNYLFPSEGGGLYAEFDAGAFCSLDVKADDYIVLDVTCLSDSSCAIAMRFGDSDTPPGESGCSVKMGLLPSIKTRLAIRFDTCEAKRLFLPRTPGKLKTVVHGRPVKPSRATSFAICTEPAPSPVILKIDGLSIYEGEPDYPLPKASLVDPLGQKSIGSWIGKTASFEEMREALTAEADSPPSEAPEDRSRFGGWLDKRLCEASGYFRLVSEGGRYWLADPDGYAFFSSGIDCVNIDGDCNLRGIKSLCGELPPESDAGWRGEDGFSWLRSNLYRVFGDGYHDKWMEITRRRLNAWGVNTVACWSELEFARFSRIPYVSIFRGYPKTSKYIFRDFPDVFSDEFRESAAKWAEQILQYRGDPYLIGYFLSNEPNWAFVNDLNIAKLALASEERLESRVALAAFMREKYKDITALNSAWGSSFPDFKALTQPTDTDHLTSLAEKDLYEFTVEMIREYIKIPSLAVRALDGDHLNLGIRYAWLSSKALAAGSEFTDIFSFNCYNMDPYDSIERISSLVEKPVMIGEFHFGALDRGLDATGIRGVASQDERGAAYKYYMLRAASHPMCLGAHYFQLNDQGYLGRFDGENYQIGFLDVCSKPYGEFIAGVKEANREIYAAADGASPVTARRATEIPAIFF